MSEGAERRRGLAFVAIVTAVVTVLGASAPAGTETKVLHFPNDRSLGELFVREADAADASVSWWWGQLMGWRYLGEATGDIRVPAGQPLALAVGPDGWKDLAPLAQLRDDDLDALVIRRTSYRSVTPDDRCVPHICGLGGLRTLVLEHAGISDEGLKSLTSLASLERLSVVSDFLGDAGLAHIAEVASLRGLRFYGPKVTPTGPAHLAKLTLLEELFPDQASAHDDSLAVFAKLPRLHYLLLSGGGYSQAGLMHLKGLTSLKRLEFVDPPVSPEWVAALAQLTQIEDLAVRNAVLDDRHVASLESLWSLRRLLLQPDFQQMGDDLGDTGLAHLAQIESLESLELRHGNFTDEGLEQLCRLRGLRSLVVPNCHRFTASGLIHLTALEHLEQLSVGSRGFTEDALAVIGQLTSLRDLTLFSGQQITNEGLARLRGLSELTRLEVWAPKVTTYGVNHLAALSNLAELDITGGYAREIAADDSILRIGTLTGLRRLRVPVFRDEDLACLAALQDLRWLEIANQGTLTDTGLAHLQHLTGLNRLEVHNANLTDDGLQYLASMSRLNYLTISGDFQGRGLRHLEGLKGLRTVRILSAHKVDPDAVLRLQGALPSDARIQRQIAKPPQPRMPRLQVGRKLLDFENIRIDFSADENEGKAILLCFFDMQQRPSRNTMQELACRSEALSRKNVAVIAVQATEVGRQALDEWIEQNSIAFPVGTISDSLDATRLAWGAKSLPWLILTDAQHIVRAEGFGLDALDEEVARLSRDGD
ncbi:MAG: redoxin domain-containing protein [Sedimentisphaerales bacterium]|nr:redoxin domain-containing protein [Sedimentisphaerales bacterium]